MDLEHLFGVAVRFVGIVVQSEGDPIVFTGHGIGQIALAEQADGVAVVQLDRLGQLVEILRIGSLAEVGLLLDADGIVGRPQAQVVILIDGVGDAAQPLAQLDLLLPADAEGGDGHGHGRKNADDGHDGDQFGNGES